MDDKEDDEGGGGDAMGERVTGVDDSVASVEVNVVGATVVNLLSEAVSETLVLIKREDSDIGTRSICNGAGCFCRVCAGAVWLLFSALGSLSRKDCNNCGSSMTSNKQRFWSIIHNKWPWLRFLL